MEDSGATQVLEPVEATDGSGGSGGGTRAPSAAGTGGPRKWLALGVIAVLLVAAAAVWWAVFAGGSHETADAEIKVPDLRGMTLDRAGTEVLAAGLQPGKLSYAVVEASVAPSGTVLSQEPLPGEMLAPGSAIDIVLAQGKPAPVVATTQPAPEAGTSAPSSSSGSGSNASTPPPPAGATPVLPDLPPAEVIDVSRLQPRVLDPGIFKLVTPEYKLVLEHEGFNGDWQSPAITFGDKPKRIWFTADGPYMVPSAVWAWGPGDADWKLKTIWASFPGAYESEDGKGGTLIEAFDAGAGTYTILVRVNPDVKWWKVRIEEQK